MFVGIGILVLAVLGYIISKPALQGTETVQKETPEVQTQTVSEPPPLTEVQDQPDVKEFFITAQTFEFFPALITVSEGDRVRLKIRSLDVPHGFAMDEFGIKEGSTVGQITTVEFTASKKGTFRFYCSLYCGQGHKEMEGEINVQ